MGDGDRARRPGASHRRRSHCAGPGADGDKREYLGPRAARRFVFQFGAASFFAHRSAATHLGLRSMSVKMPDFRSISIARRTILNGNAGKTTLGPADFK